MAGRMISELDSATSLQNTDLIPLARGNQTLKLSGGLLTPTGGGNDRLFFENDQVMKSSYNISPNKNAMSVGPITINNGINLNIPDGSNYIIL